MNGNKKWLTDQLLDIFQYHKQVKKLIPAIVGYTQSGQPKYKKSPKFTSTLRMVLLAIVKYDQCYMSLQTISDISGVDRRNVQPNVKILVENDIISVSKRYTQCGDPDSNYYIFNMEVFLSFFEKRKEVGIKHPHLSVDNSEGVGIKHPYGRDKTSLGVGIKHPPIKQALKNKDKKQEEEPHHLCDSNFDYKTKEFSLALSKIKGFQMDEAEDILEKFYEYYIEKEGKNQKRKDWFKAAVDWCEREFQNEKKKVVEEEEKPKPREYFAQEVQVMSNIYSILNAKLINRINDDEINGRLEKGS